MEKFRIGKYEEVDVLGYGTWLIGGNSSPDYSRDEYYVKVLTTAFELGYRLIDTAEYYGGGHTEELVGKALKKFNREEFFIISKVWPTHLHYDDVLKAAENSLRRLELKHVDLYLIHWPNPNVPIEETVSALERLVEEGKVRYIGVSNFSVQQLKEAIEATRKYDIVANEVKYSVWDRRVEDELLPFAEQNNVRIIAYTPLERGKGVKGTILDEMAKKYGKTVNQIALNYLISMKTIPIPKAEKREHMIENLGAVGWRIGEEDLNMIKRSL
ncbi:MAG: aldo/keto reductase [Nitrososphaeria archaeon]|nr:aldo/keto reductase [Nitrososphaeria archaeon]